VSVARLTQNGSNRTWVVGGYASVPWVSRNGYAQDDRALLFHVSDSTSPKKREVEIFRTTNPGHSFYDHVHYGPTFGAGHDLQLFQNNTELFFNASPNSFRAFAQRDLPPRGNTSQQNLTLHVQVLQLVELEILARPFRSLDLSDSGLRRLLAQAAAFSPPPPLRHANVLLFGGVGAGKSSVISTLDSICKGRISRKA
jgi:hypothetical protein